MIARTRVGALALVSVLSLDGCSHNSINEASYDAPRKIKIDGLVARPSPSTLTAAALLSYPSEGGAQALELIQRAEMMAPQRPEFVWVERSICQRLSCDSAQSIDNRLKALDRDNGFTWLSDLERAKESASDDAITEAIMKIGAGKTMTFYWNALEVTVFDGLAVAAPNEKLSTRALEAIGMVAAQAIPPLQTITKPCRVDKLGLPARREACQEMATRMEHADSVIIQSLALSIREHWWPVGSPEHDSLRSKRRQLDYEIEMSSQMRWRMDHDFAIRMEAARRSEREEDVMLAVMRAYGIPLAVPSDWKDKHHPV